MKAKPSRRQHDGPTLADVARHAGVSPMTVSRVINGEANVRAKTRDLVNKAIDELGYQPNQAARSLAGANQIRVGLLYSNPSESYLSAFLLGALEQVRVHHLQLIVEKCEVGEQAEETARELINSGIDGIILPAPLSYYAPLIRVVGESGTPTVAVVTSTPEDLAVEADAKLSSLSTVSIYDYEAAYEMTSHIIGLGHTRIGFITGDLNNGASQIRRRGFIDAMNKVGIDVPDELIEPGLFTYRSGLDAAEKLLQLDDKPTAIFASNDDMAAATVAVAHRQGLDVPGDLTVCGFDDSALATAIWPELTTIHQPIADLSHEGVDRLVKMIKAQRNGNESPNCYQQLGFTLVRRQSDAPPRRRPSVANP